MNEKKPWLNFESVPSRTISAGIVIIDERKGCLSVTLRDDYGDIDLAQWVADQMEAIYTYPPENEEGWQRVYDEVEITIKSRHLRGTAHDQP